MNAPPLPEDLSAWPVDPYALLGVSPGADPRDLRRAYTRLIRTYKPEHFPEQFRRVREAYEAALRRLPSGGTSTAGPPPAAPQPPGRQEIPPRRGATDLDGRLRAEWRRACRGEEGEAYRALLDLRRRHPADVAIPLRLYWLLKFFPEADPVRKPRDWLVSGLLAGGLTGPLRELYRCELQEDPEAAADEACAGLLLRVAGSDRVLDVAEWRWRAAARLERWERIIADTGTLRKAVCQADPERWVRLLLLAVNHLAWGRTAEARKHTDLLGKEALGYEHLHTRLGPELDRMERTQHLSLKWHALVGSGKLTGVVADLIAASTGSEDDLQPRLEAFLAAVGRQPRIWLDALTTLRGEAGVLLDSVLSTLNSQLSSAGGSRPPARPQDEVRAAVADHLDLQPAMTYDEFRIALFEFCLREWIAPEAVAAHVKGRDDYWLTPDEHLSQAISADTPLLCVCLAHRMFRA